MVQHERAARAWPDWRATRPRGAARGASMSDQTTSGAAGSSFYAGMRILPRARREAMYAIYGFCRAVDDIADGDALCDDPHAALDAWRADIDALFDGRAPGRAAPLAGPVARYGLARADFHAVIDGMAMDLDGPIVAPDRATLDLYCDRVASAVGRLSTPVFGMAADPGRALAHHLGRALQLTNILRDLDEDAARGRLYLPREDLDAAGAPTGPAALAHPGLEPVCRSLVHAARAHYAHAGALMDAAPRAAVRAPRVMRYAYSDVLERLDRRGFAPPRARVGVRKPRLAWGVLRWGLA